LDRQGDRIRRGAFSRWVADVNAGRISVPLVAHHSEDPRDVVGHILHAEEDATGLLIRAGFAPDTDSQLIRGKVVAGALSNFSIQYVPSRSQPLPGGGRELQEVEVLHVALVVGPANGSAMVTSAKGRLPSTVRVDAPSSWAPVVTVKQNIAEAATRNDPDRAQRERMARIVAASSLSPALQAALSTETAYALIEDAAARKAAREVAQDEPRRVQRERWQKANDYSTALHASMKLPPANNCGHCAACRVGGGHCLYPVR
jgi:HK97 family phage prohead protease